jgi:predicted O-methyltransferase YrrM
VTAEPVPTPERWWLTPRYVGNRLRDLAYQRAHPDAPWLTPAAIGMLTTLLRPADRGLEFGSGRSTLWFASRVASLTSVETNRAWHKSVSAKLKERGYGHVDYILVPEDQPEQLGDHEYARTALALPDASLDFALVDGYYRDYSAKYVMPKVKPGELLIIDNINWHLPTRSKGPGTRPPELGPASATWAEVWAEIEGWRRIWTTNGVWDTSLFFKPAA